VVTVDRKRLLCSVFAVGVKEGRATSTRVAKELGVGNGAARRALASGVRKGLIEKGRSGYALTPKGRRGIRVVFIGGGFEIIHRGHLYTIEKAKSMGDVLVVSVARDSTIRRRKHREPLSSEEDRVRLLSSLRPVDAALLGAEGDIYKTLEKVKPDVVALGYDQYHLESEVAKEARKRGLKVGVVRLDSPYPGVKTSAVLREF
jgi:FAD synthetase